jgi:dephospho-CoA kinase
MIVLGLTGSIGMGKSTTAAMFAEAGVPVHDADLTVHRLYEGEAAPLVETAFPGTVRDGVVDRARLAERVVGRPEDMQRLEAIVHPLVRAAERDFLDRAEAAGAPVAVLDVPLLFETGGDRRVDAVVVVTAPPEVQRERVLSRGVPPDKFEALLARQTPDAEKRRRADFIVDSSHGFDAARARVREILAAAATMQRRRL